MFDNRLFLLQLAVIIGSSHLVAAGFRRFGQPRVVGEMAAGIALGPTLFGLVAPGAYHSLFPATSLGFLNALSQAGLAIFIFLVGVRVDFAELRRQSGLAVVPSNIIGVLLVLSRILHAWSKRFDEKKLPLDSILVFVVLALVSGAVGEHLGIHALVGAFMAGLVTPRKFRQQLIDKLEAVTLLILVPLFFALTGIRTRFQFNAGAGIYLDFLLILTVAIVSKWGGTMIGARAK